MSDIFHQSLGLVPKLNNFNLSQEKYFDMNMNRLIPVAFYDCIPGDFFNIKHKVKIRCEPLVAPELSKITFNAAAFFVSYRTLWDKFQLFITGKDPNGSSLEPGSLQSPYILLRNDFKPDNLYDTDKPGVHPYPVFTPEIGSNADYFGLPAYNRPVTQVTDGDQLPISALPFAAQLSVWNWFFRDSELQEEIKYQFVGDRFMSPTTSILDDDDTREVYRNIASLFVNPLNLDGDKRYDRDFLYFNWNKDYFTSSFIRQTQGTPPTINFDGVANMTQQYQPSDTLHFGKMTVNSASGMYQFPSNRYVGTDRNAWASGNVQSVRDITNSQFFLTSGAAGTQSSLDVSFNAQALQQGLFKNLQMNVMTTLTPAQFRYIFQYNLFLERRMYAGFRYDDYLKFFFGVSPRNEVLQQPELIGAYKTPIVVSEVLQTSETTSSSPQGNLSGHGISFDFNSLGKYRVKEYGCILVYCWISTPGMYSQGVDKTLIKSDYLDYVNPAFVNLGEQPVLNQELYFSKDRSYNRSIFGYQSIYNEYRYKSDAIAGNLRKEFSFWHLGRLFNESSKPFLNSSFIRSDVDEGRIFSVTDTFKTPPFIVRSGLKVNSYRPLPLFGTPGRIDHIYGERFRR